MQKLFQNKSVTQKIIIAIVFVILFNFTCPCIVQADDYNFIFQALAWLAVKLTDCIQWIINLCLTGDNTMMMTDAIWEGKNKDQWKFSWGWHGLNVYVIEWPKRHLITPADIFTGKILITNINFFSDYKDVEKAIASKGTNLGAGKDAILDFSTDSTADNMNKLRTAISKWYSTIRNITIVGLLSVLVYIAIEMVISSASQDKAKYQKMLTDWLVAICLVFLLHYIMAITVGICEKLTNIMNDQIKEEYYMDKGDAFRFTDEEGNDIVYGSKEEGNEPIHGLVDKIRIYTQNKNSSKAMAYAIMYFAITGYTLIFLWTYMKRFVYMAFFTLIAPIVALTYPIDKVKDGSAQAFDGWLKNYIYNALIQPFNLMIYTVFIGLAYDLASSNFIYVIVVLGTIPFADKQLGSWMGMDKASTRKGIAEGLQGVLAFKGAQSLFGGGKTATASSSSGSGASGGSSSSSRPSIRTKDNAFLNSGGGTQQQTPTQQQTQTQQQTRQQQAAQQTTQQTAQQTTQQQAQQAAQQAQQAQQAAQQTTGTPGNRGIASSNYAKRGRTKRQYRNNNFRKKAGRMLWNGTKNKTAGAVRLTGKLTGMAFGAVGAAVLGQNPLHGAIGGAAVGNRVGSGIADLPGNIGTRVNNMRNTLNENFGTKEREQMQKFKGNPDLQDFYGDKTHQNVAASIATELGLDVKADKKQIKKLMDVNEQFMAEHTNLDFDTSMDTVLKAFDEASMYTREETKENRLQYAAKHGERGKEYADLIDAIKTPNLSYSDARKGRQYSEYPNGLTADQLALAQAWERRNKI